MLTVKDAEEHGIRMFSSDSMVRLVQNHAAKHVEKELAVIEHVDEGACMQLPQEHRTYHGRGR